MTAIDVGLARAIVSRPTPPDNKTILWHKQTMPQINENIGELYFYDWNPDVNAWVRLRQDGNIKVVEEFVATSGQTVFELLNDIVIEELTEFVSIPGAVLTYGEHFSITHNLPLGSTLVLNLPYSLEAGEKVVIRYQY